MTANMTSNMTATRNRQDHLSHQPRFSGANALAYNPQQGELDHIAARPNRGTPPRLRLVATTPRPAIVVRPRPTAAVYRRRRLAVLVAAVALVLAAAQATTVLGGNPLAASGHRPAVVTVAPGDTLWSVVETLAPGSDPRQIVDRLAQERGTSTLQIGERITLKG